MNQIRNVTLGGLMQLSSGQYTPLVSLRRNLRAFLEHSFSNLTPDELQNRVVEEIISHNRSYLQTLDIMQETASRSVDIPLTIENLLRKFCQEFLKLLFNNGKIQKYIKK